MLFLFLTAEFSSLFLSVHTVKLNEIACQGTGQNYALERSCPTANAVDPRNDGCQGTNKIYLL